MDATLLAKLLSQPEGLKLEFKREYQLNHSDRWNEFIKDVLSLTNGNVGTVGQPGYLIIGADDELKPDGTRDAFDIRENKLQLSQQTILQKVNSACHPPIPDLRYHEIQHNGSWYIVIEIPPSPHVHELSKHLTIANKDGKKTFYRGTVFIRHGESIAPATPDEIEALKAEKTPRKEDKPFDEKCFDEANKILTEKELRETLNVLGTGRIFYSRLEKLENLKKFWKLESNQHLNPQLKEKSDWLQASLGELLGFIGNNFFRNEQSSNASKDTMFIMQPRYKEIPDPDNEYGQYRQQLINLIDDVEFYYTDYIKSAKLILYQ